VQSTRIPAHQNKSINVDRQESVTAILRFFKLYEIIIDGFLLAFARGGIDKYDKLHFTSLSTAVSRGEYFGGI